MTSQVIANAIAEYLDEIMGVNFFKEDINMKEYHKIQTVFKRDPKTNFKTLLVGEWALPEFEYLALNEWVFTEKVDGTNIRVMWNHETKTATIGGKTDRAQIPAFLANRLADMYFAASLSVIFPDTSACLYGEGYGAKIQKGGGNYRQDQSFVLFDVKIGDLWLQREDVEDIAQKLGIEIVPVIGKGGLFNMAEWCKDGFDSTWGKFTAEGIIARPLIELKSRNGSRIITKLKHRDF